MNAIFLYLDEHRAHHGNARQRLGKARVRQTGRAINAMFGATGLANLCFIIGLRALNAGLDEPVTASGCSIAATVFILQGAAWWVAWLMRRQAPGWMLTALGWFVSGTALGLILQRDHGRLSSPSAAPLCSSVHGRCRAGSWCASNGSRAARTRLTGHGDRQSAQIDEVIHGRMRLGIMVYLADE